MYRSPEISLGSCASTSGCTVSGPWTGVRHASTSGKPDSRRRTRYSGTCPWRMRTRQRPHAPRPPHSALTGSEANSAARRMLEPSAARVERPEGENWTRCAGIGRFQAPALRLRSQVAAQRSPHVAEEGRDVGRLLRAHQHAPTVTQGILQFAGNYRDITGDD